MVEHKGNSNVPLPQFNGEDYNYWNIQMGILLIHEVVEKCGNFVCSSKGLEILVKDNRETKEE